MKIAVFGTETQDGSSFVKHALRTGFEVQLLATESNALTKLRSSRATITRGSYSDQNITHCLRNCNAAVILINEALNETALDIIIEGIETHGIPRLVVCEDMQARENYDNFQGLSLKLASTSVDWTVIKRAHEDMVSAMKQIDDSLIDERSTKRSFAAYVINQVTDDRYVGETVMLAI